MGGGGERERERERERSWTGFWSTDGSSAAERRPQSGLMDREKPQTETRCGMKTI